MRRADVQRVPNIGLGERGRHQMPPEMAEFGKVVPKLSDQLDGPEQLGAQEAAAVFRGAARYTEKEEEIRERGHVHADCDHQRGHNGPRHAGRRRRRR